MPRDNDLSTLIWPGPCFISYNLLMFPIVENKPTGCTIKWWREASMYLNGDNFIGTEPNKPWAYLPKQSTVTSRILFWPGPYTMFNLMIHQGIWPIQNITVFSKISEQILKLCEIQSSNLDMDEFQRKSQLWFQTSKSSLYFLHIFPPFRHTTLQIKLLLTKALTTD